MPPSYSTALEMLRLAPSASNKQPWRIVRQSGRWHFCLARTAGYRAGLGEKLLKLEDIQRVDMGIAMCHFELALQSLGSSGRWVTKPPAPTSPTGVPNMWLPGKKFRETRAHFRARLSHGRSVHIKLRLGSQSAFLPARPSFAKNAEELFLIAFDINIYILSSSRTDPKLNLDIIIENVFTIGMAIADQMH